MWEIREFSPVGLRENPGHPAPSLGAGEPSGAHRFREFIDVPQAEIYDEIMDSVVLATP